MSASGLAGGVAWAAVSADWLVEGPPPSKRNDPITRKKMPLATRRVRRAQTRLNEPPDGPWESGLSLTGRGSMGIASVLAGAFGQPEQAALYTMPTKRYSAYLVDSFNWPGGRPNRGGRPH